MMFTVGGLVGVALDAFSARALSAEEIKARQVASAYAMQQAHRPYGDLAWLNAYQPERKPLDERFADFKQRLAAAVARNKARMI